YSSSLPVFCVVTSRPPSPTLSPYTTLFRSYSQSPNSNPYGGGPPSPDDRDPYGHGQGQPGPHTAPSRPAFVDPYQPTDRQPTYPPAVMLHELGQESTSSHSAASPQQARRPSPASGPSTTAARVGAVACLGLTF